MDNGPNRNVPDYPTDQADDKSEYLNHIEAKIRYNFTSQITAFGVQYGLLTRISPISLIFSTFKFSPKVATSG